MGDFSLGTDFTVSVVKLKGTKLNKINSLKFLFTLKMHVSPCQGNTNSVLKEINTYCKYRNEDFYNSSFFKTAIQIWIIS